MRYAPVLSLILGIIPSSLPENILDNMQLGSLSTRVDLLVMKICPPTLRVIHSFIASTL